MSNESNKNASLNRRKFLSAAGIFAAGVAAVPAWALPSESTGDRLADAAEPGSEPPANKIASILESKVICIEKGKFLGQGTEYALNINGHVVITKKVTEPSRYLGWPTITKTKDGQLIVAFSGDRDAHVCPFGKTQVIISKDDGKTWSVPVTINNSPLDDRDAGLIQTKKGTLLVSWFTSLAFEKPVYEAAYQKYFRIGDKIPAETKKQWLGNWVRRSEDNGETWQKPVKTVVTAPHGPVCLQNGNLLYVGTALRNGKTAVLVERSVNDGKTWKVISEIPQPAGLISSLSEPHVLELRSGKLLAMIRNEPKDTSQCFLLQSESTDGGKTWSVMKSSGIWGYPPHLIQLANGWLLVAYGYRKEPYGERACISKDEGRSWDTANEINLSNAASRDLGYPSSVQLADGSILTVFYQAPKFAEPTCLMSTHWKLT